MAAESADAALARQLQEEFDAEVRRKEANERFECPICIEPRHLDHSVELDCGHRFCASCFSDFLELLIQEKRVKEDELVCPMPKCKTLVTVPQVEGVTKGTPLWDRFLQTRADMWRPAAVAKGRLQAEIHVQCSNPRCDSAFLVTPKVANVQCPKCRQVYCRMCGDHHPGKTCEEHAKRRAKVADAGDEALEALAEECGWQRCPACRTLTDRETGCNYMTCNSHTCRGSVSFCYLCGEKLSTVEHISHFPYGAFANVCRNVDKRDDARVAPASWGTAKWFSAVARDVKNLVAGQGIFDVLAPAEDQANVAGGRGVFSL